MNRKEGKYVKRLRWVLLTGGVLIVTEFILRFYFGFCDALLYQSSDKYEYIAQPNQSRHRFGVTLLTNSFSQRSEEPDSTKTLVLGLGDSVIFGGSWMDQDSLATTLFTKETGMQMLNISCGSWGPDNSVAYLKEKGTFGAKATLLVCSSHDAFDSMSFAPVVGVMPNYPTEQYSFAIWEAIDRYLIPYLNKMTHNRKYADPDAVVEKLAADRQVVQKSKHFVKGFDALKHIADSLSIPMCVYLHAERGELEQRRYNDMGQQILLWADTSNVRLIDGIKEGERLDMYHDAIHLNNRGQRHLADVLQRVVKP